MESRLLLEEDLEFILHVHDWHAFLKAKICSKYRLAFAAVSSIVSVSLMVISKANILTVFFLLPPSLEAIFLLQQKYSEICLKRNIRSLIDSLKNLSRLNVEIANYLKTREIVRYINCYLQFHLELKVICLQHYNKCRTTNKYIMGIERKTALYFCRGNSTDRCVNEQN